MHELNAYVRSASGDAPVPSLPHLVNLSPASSVYPSFSIVLFLNPRYQGLSLIQLVNRLTTIAVATQTCICVLSFLFFFDQIQTVLCMVKSKCNLTCVCVYFCPLLPWWLQVAVQDGGYEGATNHRGEASAARAERTGLRRGQFKHFLYFLSFSTFSTFQWRITENKNEPMVVLISHHGI